MTTININYEYILFDLDGTLVESSKNYFLMQNTISLYMRFSKLFGPIRTVLIVRKSIAAMLANSKSNGVTNYERLIQICQKESGEHKEFIEYHLEQYYQSDFLKWSHFFKPVPYAKEFLKRALDNQKKLYVWTNPIWPEFNVKKRLEWGGFDTNNFSGFTHSQNSMACKPNIEYFQNSLALFGLDPKKCLLIGDSETKDGPAKLAGIETIILMDDKAQSWQSLSSRLFPVK